MLLRNYQIVFVLLLTLSISSWSSDNNLFSGGSGATTDPYKIANYKDLQNLSKSKIHQNLSYVLSQDIDASESAENPIEPIGTYLRPFTGSFDGNGFKIQNLTINKDTSNVALFAHISKVAEIKNLGIINASISGLDSVAGLVAQSEGIIKDCYVTGEVHGNNLVGGLVAHSKKGRILKSYSNASVYGDNYVGGLVGVMNSTWIDQSFANGIVSSNAVGGGLIGYAQNSKITLSYANSIVMAEAMDIPILIGKAHSINVENSYNFGYQKQTLIRENIKGSKLKNFYSYYLNGKVNSHSSEKKNRNKLLNHKEFEKYWNQYSGEYPRLKWQKVFFKDFEIVQVDSSLTLNQTELIKENKTEISHFGLRFKSIEEKEFSVKTFDSLAEVEDFLNIFDSTEFIQIQIFAVDQNDYHYYSRMILFDHNQQFFKLNDGRIVLDDYKKVKLFLNNPNFWDDDVILTKNINANLSEDENSGKGIAISAQEFNENFTGTFYSNNFSITNLKLQKHNSNFPGENETQLLIFHTAKAPSAVINENIIKAGPVPIKPIVKNKTSKSASKIKKAQEEKTLAHHKKKKNKTKNKTKHVNHPTGYVNVPYNATRIIRGNARKARDIERVVRNKARYLRYDYDRNLRYIKNLEGMLVLNVSINAKGNVTSISVASGRSDIYYSRFIRDVKNEIKRWKFKRILSKASEAKKHKASHHNVTAQIWIEFKKY